MTPILDPRFLAVAAVVASTALPAAADAVDGAARGVTKLEVYASADDEQPQRLVDVREVRFPLPVVETDGDFLQVRLGGRLVWLDGRQVRVDKPLEWACVPSAAKPGFVAATQGAAGALPMSAATAGRAVVAAIALLAALAAMPARADRPDFGDTAPPPVAAAAADAGQAARDAELKSLQSAGLGLAQMPTVQAYLDALLQRVQQAAPPPVVPARVVIRPRLAYNAASTALGHIVVDLGWLKSINGEPELAALLAHEYAHVQNGHLGTRNAVGTASHWALTAIAIAKQGRNELGRGLAGDTWASLLAPGWGRSQEFEADAYALDVTQAMGYAFVPGVRAFLDRIASIEKRDRQGGADLGDDHPSATDRLDAVQQLAAQRPRVRSAKGADAWRALRDSPAFRREEAEYLLVGRYLDADAAGDRARAAEALRQVVRRAAPPVSAAAVTLRALGVPEPAARIGELDRAIAAPDASFAPYTLKAVLQRDALGDFAGGVATLRAGLERFDSPAMHFPAVIEFERETGEKIGALPPAARNLSLNLLTVKLSLARLALNARCRVEPEFAEACAWAALDAQQRAEQLRLQQQKQADLERKVQQKLDKLFK